MCFAQGDWVWLEPDTGARGEYVIAVGAVVKNVDHHKIYLVDDDRKVFHVTAFSIMLSCSLYRILSATPQMLVTIHIFDSSNLW